MKIFSEAVKVLVLVGFFGEYLADILPNGKLRNTLKAGFVFYAFFLILSLMTA